MANLSKAFQLSLATVCLCWTIPSHASKNTHTNTHSKTTSRWQRNFGSRGLSIMPKAPARISSKDEDIRDSWHYLSRKTMQILVLSNFTQSYYMHAQTHVERLKRSAPDARSHRRHTCTSMLSGETKTAREAVIKNKKSMQYEGRNTGGILGSKSNEYISEGWC